MIEDLYEYLVRYGWNKNIANDICDAYSKGNDAVVQYAQFFNDDEHDYADEIIEAIRAWRYESGEAGE